MGKCFQLLGSSVDGREIQIFSVSNVDTFCNDLLVVVLGLAVLLLLFALF